MGAICLSPCGYVALKSVPLESRDFRKKERRNVPWLAPRAIRDSLGHSSPKPLRLWRSSN